MELPINETHHRPSFWGKAMLGIGLAGAGLWVVAKEPVGLNERFPYVFVDPTTNYEYHPSVGDVAGGLILGTGLSFTGVVKKRLEDIEDNNTRDINE